MRDSRVAFLLCAVILAAVLAGPAFAGEVVTYRYRITIGDAYPVCSLFSIPGDGKVIGVRFSGRYRNVGSGFDAARAEFYLFGPSVWAIQGNDLGWSGQGTFGPSIRNSSVFNGPLGPGPSGWELCSYSPTNGSGANFVDSEFSITVRYGQIELPEPEHPDL